MKRYKGDKWCFGVLVILSLFFCWLFVGRFGMFGAKVDWISQHSVLPEYFRQQFYDTGQLFPEFAPNIGGGQNIYNFAYYGLYSPIVLFSYFLPFIKMGEYLMIASVVGLVSAVLLLYIWLRRNDFGLQISFCVALLFLLAGPMIYHSYSQVMFVNYMPFLCLAFIGVDRYFEKGKAGCYTISVFLMIMTSFYFSVGGMLVLLIYGLYRYWKEKEETCYPSIWRFIRDGLQFLWPMLIAVLMSGILLVPTAMALAGRQTGQQGENILGLKELLLPTFSPMRFVYHPYGIGLTVLLIVVLLTGMTYRKISERILAWGCVIVLSVPLFCYLLNGGLYARDKALIPFLPLLCYLIAYYFQKQERGEIMLWRGILPCLLTMGFLLFSKGEINNSLWWSFLLLDSVIVLVSILIFFRKRCLAIVSVPPIVCMILFGIVFHQNDGRVLEREFYEKVTDIKTSEIVEETLNADQGFYRMEEYGSIDENAANLNRVWNERQYISSVYSSTYNSAYQEFRTKFFELEEPFRNFLMQPVAANPVYRKLMGVRYIVSNQKVLGYEICEEIKGEGENGKKVYYSDETAPIIYATDRLISREEYEKLEFPYNQTVLASYAVTEEHVTGKEGWREELENEIKEVPCEISATAAHSSKIFIEDKETKNKGRIFYLQFQVKNYKPEKDVSIWLNGVRNKLTSIEHTYSNGNTTFTWAIALEENQQEVEIVFGKGEYEIEEVKAFVSSIDIGATESLYQSEINVNWDKTKGNRIQGNLNVEDVKQVVTSIPYDENYEVQIDGKQVPYGKVNMSFLGFVIGSGEHEVIITYHAPGVRTGKILSVTGWVMFFVLLYKRKSIPTD